MANTDKKSMSLYVDKSEQRLIEKLRRHTKKNANTKAIMIAVQEYPALVSKLEKTTNKLNLMICKHNHLIRTLQERNRIDDEINTLIKDSVDH